MDDKLSPQTGHTETTKQMEAKNELGSKEVIF